MSQPFELAVLHLRAGPPQRLDPPFHDPTGQMRTNIPSPTCATRTWDAGPFSSRARYAYSEWPAQYADHHVDGALEPFALQSSPRVRTGICGGPMLCLAAVPDTVLPPGQGE